MQACLDYKYNTFGVTRLLNEGQLRDIIQAQNIIESYVITTEEKGTSKEHVHFFFQSNNKHNNISYMRTYLKKIICETFTPDQCFENGKLNFTKPTKDKPLNPVQCITYLCKDGYPTFVHNYDITFIKECSRKSFAKKISMTQAILNLKDELYNQNLTPTEYTIEYRLTRNKYRKPDPNWEREFRNAEEGLKTKEEIKKEVYSFQKLKSQY